MKRDFYFVFLPRFWPKVYKKKDNKRMSIYKKRDRHNWISKAYFYLNMGKSDPPNRDSVATC